MKFKNTTIHEKTWLKIHKMINNQTKNELLHIWTWIIIWNESSFNVLYQFVMTFKRQFNQQTSAVTAIHDCWKWKKLILHWFNWQHEIKHEIHIIWTSDQMKKIWMKNMKIIYNDKEKHINFDKRISWKSFFTICFNWMNKKKKSMIVS